MGTTLTNGVYLPDEGERNCYAGLKTNWEILDQKVADVTALQQAVAGALHREIVESLPTTDIDPNTIYMVLSGTSATENVYNEFMYVNNAWELIGTSATDLTNYYTKSEVDGKLLLKASVSDLTAHTGNTDIHVTASDKTKWTNSANTHVLRLAKSALTPSSSTNAFSNLDDATALKVGDKVMDTAGVLFEVTAIDTANSTFTIGTALIDLAQDSDVVHKSGNETIGGEKTFLDVPISFKSSIAELGVTGGNTKVILTDKNLLNLAGIFLGNYGSSKLSYCRFCIYDKNSDNQEIEKSLEFAFISNNQNAYFRPNTSNFVTLGTTSYRWKDVFTNKINSLEPSSLSLPSGDLNAVVDISSYLTNLDGTANTYLAPANGWISISMSNCTGIQAFITGFWGNQIVRPTAGAARFLMPILKNQTATILIYSGTIDNARFIPCQGNV